MHVIDSNLGNRTIDVMNKPMYENTTWYVLYNTYNGEMDQNRKELAH
jgi:hypothetical protein